MIVQARSLLVWTRFFSVLSNKILTHIIIRILKRILKKFLVSLFFRMDTDGSLNISFNEWRDFLLYAPSHDIGELIKYWRHSSAVSDILLLRTEVVNTEAITCPVACSAVHTSLKTFAIRI